MWCEQIVRNAQGDLEDTDTSGALDVVDIDWTECGRVLKAVSRGGRAVRVLLPPGQRLSHGDVIFEDVSQTVVIKVRLCELIVARPVNAAGMAILALELGNLHWPAQIDGDEIIFPEDGPAMEIIAKLKTPWVRQERRFTPAIVSAGPAVKLAGGFVVLRGGTKSA